jgi:peptide/nickel transport system substrate-binding protein
MPLAEDGDVQGIGISGRSIMRRLGLGLILAALSAVIFAACASDPEIVEVERVVEVVKEVQVPVEVEVPVEIERKEIVEVEKVVTVEIEVVKEVEVEVEVERVEIQTKLEVATPTPPPAGTPRFGGTLRIVSQASIATLDAVWSPFYVVVAVGQHLYETPLGWNSNLTPGPRMVDSWTVSDDERVYTFTLRDGMTFHDGQAVTSADVVASLKRWLPGGSARATLMRDFTAEEPFLAIDDLTFEIRMNQPYGGVIPSVSPPHWGPFVMPERIAGTTAVTEGANEYIGSSPYRLVRWDQGYQVVLERHEGYKARSEPADHMIGASVSYLDKLIWLEVPDEETKIAGLQTGEWDVVDGAAFDFFQPLTDDPSIVVPLYKPGHRSAMNISPNNPPFGNESLVLTDAQLNARKAVQATIDIEAVMHSLGDSNLWTLCPAIYYCGTPLETFEAGEFYHQANPDLGMELLAASDYDGETVVLLNPTDYGTITPTGIVLRAQMQDIGLNVEMPALDWATIVGRFAETDSYHMFTDWYVHWCCDDPIAWPNRDGVPGRHPYNEEGIELRVAYAQATDQAERFALVELIQRNMYEEVISILLGQFFSIYPHTADLKNFEVKAIPFYVNTWLER